MPYAIIKTGGKQYRVEPGRTYRIPTLVGDAGSDVEFNEVLLGSDGTNVAGPPSMLAQSPLLQAACVCGFAPQRNDGLHRPGLPVP